MRSVQSSHSAVVALLVLASCGSPRSHQGQYCPLPVWCLFTLLLLGPPVAGWRPGCPPHLARLSNSKSSTPMYLAVLLPVRKLLTGTGAIGTLVPSPSVTRPYYLALASCLLCRSTDCRRHLSWSLLSAPRYHHLLLLLYLAGPVQPGYLGHWQSSPVHAQLVLCLLCLPAIRRTSNSQSHRLVKTTPQSRYAP